MNLTSSMKRKTDCDIATDAGSRSESPTKRPKRDDTVLDLETLSLGSDEGEHDEAAEENSGNRLNGLSENPGVQGTLANCESWLVGYDGTACAQHLFTVGLLEAACETLAPRSTHTDRSNIRGSFKSKVFTSLALLAKQHPGYVLIQHDLVRNLVAKELKGIEDCPRKSVKSFEVANLGHFVKRKLGEGRTPFILMGDAHSYYDVEGGAPVKLFIDFDGAKLVEHKDDPESVQNGWTIFRVFMREFKDVLCKMPGGKAIDSWLSVHMCDELSSPKPSAHAHDLAGAWAQDVDDLGAFVNVLYSQCSEGLQALLDTSIYSKGRAFRMTGMSKWEINKVTGEDCHSNDLRVLSEYPDPTLSGELALRLFELNRVAFELLLFPHIVHPDTARHGTFIPSRDLSPSLGDRKQEPVRKKHTPYETIPSLVVAVPSDNRVAAIVELISHIGGDHAESYEEWKRVMLALRSCGKHRLLNRAWIEWFRRWHPETEKSDDDLERKLVGRGGDHPGHHCMLNVRHLARWAQEGAALSDLLKVTHAADIAIDAAQSMQLTPETECLESILDNSASLLRSIEARGEQVAYRVGEVSKGRVVQAVPIGCGKAGSRALAAAGELDGIPSVLSNCDPSSIRVLRVPRQDRFDWVGTESDLGWHRYLMAYAMLSSGASRIEFKTRSLGWYAAEELCVRGELCKQALGNGTEMYTYTTFAALERFVARVVANSPSCKLVTAHGCKSLFMLLEQEIALLKGSPILVICPSPSHRSVVCDSLKRTMAYADAVAILDGDNWDWTAMRRRVMESALVRSGATEITVVMHEGHLFSLVACAKLLALVESEPCLKLGAMICDPIDHPMRGAIGSPFGDMATRQFASNKLGLSSLGTLARHNSIEDLPGEARGAQLFGLHRYRGKDKYSPTGKRMDCAPLPVDFYTGPHLGCGSIAVLVSEPDKRPLRALDEYRLRCRFDHVHVVICTGAPTPRRTLDWHTRCVAPLWDRASPILE